MPSLSSDDDNDAQLRLRWRSSIPSVSSSTLPPPPAYIGKCALCLSPAQSICNLPAALRLCGSLGPAAETWRVQAHLVANSLLAPLHATQKHRRFVVAILPNTVHGAILHSPLWSGGCTIHQVDMHMLHMLLHAPVETVDIGR